MLKYDVRKMRELLKSFYALTQIRIVVFDTGFRKIAEYPEGDCAFCRMIREHPEARRRCAESDRKACERSRDENGLYIYSCHAGLAECVAPIHHGEIVIGYLMFGQVRLRRDGEQHWLEVRELCERWGLDSERTRAALEEKPFVEKEQVAASAQIMEACSGYLWLSRMISLQENSLPQALSEYIALHMDGDLSTNALCRRFQISRSRLYRLAREFWGCGIETAIREARVQRAKELLEQTRTPVADVAGCVGYPDYNYFIKVFRSATGTTPASYRKRIGSLRP